MAEEARKVILDLSIFINECDLKDMWVEVNKESVDEIRLHVNSDFHGGTITLVDNFYLPKGSYYEPFMDDSYPLIAVADSRIPLNNEEKRLIRSLIYMKLIMLNNKSKEDEAPRCEQVLAGLQKFLEGEKNGNN